VRPNCLYLDALAALVENVFGPLSRAMRLLLVLIVFILLNPVTMKMLFESTEIRL
jgi:multisubunit Na+/H+ antiporter MnhG subunit